MVTDKGILISKPGKDVADRSQTYEYQLISSRGALLEKVGEIEQVGDFDDPPEINHDTRNAIPLVLQFRYASDGFSHAAQIPAINSAKFTFTTSSFYRIFFNQQKPNDP